MKSLATLKLVFELVPLLISVIKAIEDAIPGQGKGEQKIAAVREIVEEAYGNVASLWPILFPVISTLVSLFNKTGAFEKSSASPDSL